MKDSVKNVIRKLGYSISANLIYLLVSIFVSFFVPKFLGIDQYGYWQLYIFYVGYIGLFHFGLADGVYIRYGGKYYEQLDKPVLHSQFWFLCAIEILVFVSMTIVALKFSIDDNRLRIIVFTALNCVVYIPRVFLQMVLQCTGKIKEYAQNHILERVLYFFLLLLFLWFGYRNFQYLLLADLIAKTIALFSIVYICKDIVFSKRIKLPQTIAESKKNFSSGSKVMFANITSFLTIGIVRFGIERVWDIGTFGKVSFALSIASFILTFLMATGVVFFPIIKRSTNDQMLEFFNLFGLLLSVVMSLFLLAFYPAKMILLRWLPQYYEAIVFLSILFPLCVFEARNYLLINTYMKALRKEKAMVILNTASVMLSLGFTAVFVFWLKNLILTLFSIVILHVFKCFLPDIYLQRKMKMKYSPVVVQDLLNSIVFIYCNWYMSGVYGFTVYIFYIGVSYFFRRKTIHRYFVSFQKLVI